MKFGSVCSGIEAASCAFGPLGWKAAWLAETDVSASKLLAHRLGATAPIFPLDEAAAKRAAKFEWGDGLPNWGDMTKLPDPIRSGEAEAPDVLCGGTPCQSYSVAGRQEGLADARGQLTLKFVDLADEIDNARAERGLEPCIIFWENVPGILGNKQNAFGNFIGDLAGAGDPVEPGPRPEQGRSSAHWSWKKDSGQHVPKWTRAGVVVGPRRTVAWRTFDAQYFGLAQRRERVFVVASARMEVDPAEILLEFDGLRRDSAPRREAGQEVTGPLDACSTAGGFPGTDGACSGHVVPAARSGVADGTLAPQWWDGRPVSQTLDAVLHKGQTMPEKDRFPAVLQPVPVCRCNACGYTFTDQHGTDVGGLSPYECPRCGEEQAVFQPVALHGTQDPPTSDVAFPLGRNSGQENVILYDPVQVTNRSDPKPNSPAHTLPAQTTPPIVVGATGQVSHTLTGEGFDTSEDGTGRGTPIVTFDLAVRRLMPVECERLQGFPDTSTDIPGASDGARYKQLGNSWPVSVVNWIGRRIDAQVRGLAQHTIEGDAAWLIAP